MLSKNQIKEIQSLHLKKGREARGLFITEGNKSVNELLEFMPSLIVCIYGTSSFLASHPQLASHSLSVVEVSEEELKKISLQNTPNQVMAVCRQMKTESIAFNFETGFALYLDDIRDPGNFGTMIRLADWFGIRTVFCSPDCCEFYNPKVIQSSMGAFLRVKVHYIDLKDMVRQYTIPNIYGAVLNGNNIYTEHLKNGILVIGNEANGIRPENLPLITRAVTIPSGGTGPGAESLNAAMAASILVSEYYRQNHT